LADSFLLILLPLRNLAFAWSCRCHSEHNRRCHNTRHYPMHVSFTPFFLREFFALVLPSPDHDGKLRRQIVKFQS
jgi:hypothetical protein